MQKIYTSLFKDWVRVTQGYSAAHRAVDLSKGVVRTPYYLPNRAKKAVVWRIIKGYWFKGKFYKNGWIIWLKHEDGSGSRYIHSCPKDIFVREGQQLKAGDLIAKTGACGYAFGDHLHFEWLTRYNDLRSRVNPLPYISEKPPVVSTNELEKRLSQCQKEKKHLVQEIDKLRNIIDAQDRQLVEKQKTILQQGKEIDRINARLKIVQAELKECRKGAEVCVKVKNFLVKLLRAIRIWLEGKKKKS